MKASLVPVVVWLTLASSFGCHAEVTILDDGPAPSPAACEVDGRIHGEGEWARSLGAPGEVSTAYGAALVRSPDGRLVAAWRSAGAVTIDCTEAAPIGEVDLVVASFEPDGALAWVRRFGSSSADPLVAAVITGHGLDVDDEGNLYVTGTGPYDGKMTVGDEEVAAELFAFVLDPDGSVKWARGYEKGSNTSGRLVASTVSPEGELTVAYEYQGTLDLDGFVIEGGGRDEDIGRLLVTWNESGDVVRTSIRSDAGLAGLRAGPNGLLAVGWHTLYGAGELELRHDGSVVWSEASDRVPSTFWFHDGELVTSGMRGVTPARTWLRALDVTNGGLLWSTAFDSWRGADGEWAPYASHLVELGPDMVLAAPLLGEVDLGALDFGTGDVDASIVESAGGFDALLLRVGPGGLPTAIRRLGSSGNETVFGLAAADDTRVGVLFGSDGSLDLGFTSVPAACEAPCDALTLAVIHAPLPADE
jgi:hypothetical protein